MAKLRAVQSDLAYQGDFSSPAFELVGSFATLLGRLHARLATFGLRPGDLKLEPGQGLADSALACSLPGLNAVVRVRVERVEANFLELRRVTQDQVAGIILQAVGAVQDLLPQVSFKSHSIGLSAHGLFEDIVYEDFIQRYAPKSPEDLGPALGRGVVCYYGPEEERDSSLVVLDKSLLVPGGLYLRTHFSLNGAKVPLADVQSKASAYVNLILEKVGLEINWGA